jgi:hypothetical protein
MSHITLLQRDVEFLQGSLVKTHVGNSVGNRKTCIDIFHIYCLNVLKELVQNFMYKVEMVDVKY